MKECPECGYRKKSITEKLAKKLYDWLGDAFGLNPLVRLTEEEMRKLINNHIEEHQRLMK